MGSFTVAALAVLVVGQAGSSPESSAATAATTARTAISRDEQPRSRADLDRLVTASLQREATAATSLDRADAVRELVKLHQEIVASPALSKSAAAAFRERISIRLQRIRRELPARDAQSQVAADRSAKVPAMKPPTVSRRDADHVIGRDTLAQVPGGAQPAIVTTSGAAELADLIQDIVEPAAWERNGGNGVIRTFGQSAKVGGRDGDALAQVGGGAGRAPGDRRGGPAPFQLNENAGAELAALIEDVIEPASWESRGGDGVIVFLPGKNVLVVRQTDEVHEAIGGTIDQIRRN